MAPQSWPSAIDYVAAVQDPEICVISDRLSGAQFKMNMMGIPVVKSGQTAAVFPVTMGDAGQALRLFTRICEPVARCSGYSVSGVSAR